MKKKLDIDYTFLSFYRTALTKVSLFFLFLPSIIFLLIFTSIFIVNEKIQKSIRNTSLPPVLFSSFTPTSYPVLQTAGNDPLLEKLRLASLLTAQGALIMDNDSKVILFSKNPTSKFLMASSTKIMTALVGLEQYKLDDVLTIYSADVPPAVVGYPVGEKVRFIDLLYGMMLPSGNDAALAIAQNYPGGEEEFIKRMNEKAKALSLNNTHFSDSSGLDNENYTTVVELAHLTSVALQNPILAKVVATKQINTTNANGTKVYPLTNINQLLGKYGVQGVKTGFTPDAGGILVTVSQTNNKNTVYVVMRSEDRFADSEKLLLATYDRIYYKVFSSLPQIRMQ